MHATLIVLAALASGTPHDPDPDAIKKEIAGLQGEWVVASAEAMGKKLSNEERSSEFILTKVVVSDATVRLWLSNKGADAREGNPNMLRVDPSKKPHVLYIDDIPMIYSRDGDTLRVGFHSEFPKELDRLPTSFDTNMNEKWYVFVFKREKK